MVGPGELEDSPVKGTSPLLKKLRKKEGGRKFAKETECCFPMAAADRPVSEPSGFPIPEESRFAARNIQDQCGDVDRGVWQWEHRREPGTCGETLLASVSCPLCHCE